MLKNPEFQQKFDNGRHAQRQVCKNAALKPHLYIICYPFRNR